MPHDYGRPVEPGESLAQAGYIVCQGCLRELRGGDLITLGLQVPDDGAPARAVGEGAMYEDDIWMVRHVLLLGLVYPKVNT
jgi:hypothetical protein